MRSLAGALALAVLLGACGSDGESAPPTGTSLRVVVTLEDGGEPQPPLALECDPAGGDLPQPAQACEALADAGREVFDPVPADQPCAEIYGGPQTAEVTGTYDGEKVAASFSRQNGCEIDRWDRLGTTFFDVPML